MPVLSDLASAPMTARTGDKFNPPGLTNFLGSLQVATDVMGIQHLTFPPFSQGDTLIGLLEINGTGAHTGGNVVTYEWQPDRVDRAAEIDGFAVSTRTVMGVGAQSATIVATIMNPADESRVARIRVRTGAGVIQSTDGWHTPYSPKEGPAISVTPWEGTPPPETLVSNVRTVLEDGSGLLYRSRTSGAHSLQASLPAPDRIDRSWLEYEVTIPAKGDVVLTYGIFVGETETDVEAAYNRWRINPTAEVDAAASNWQKEIDAVFTPANDRYSGHLPTLDCEDPALRRIYHNAMIGVVYHKRIHPRSAYGRTYTTLMPRYWVTTSFINDWSFSAFLLVMLDPACVKKQLELWLERDIYAHFGTEYVSGSNAGNWYSCNDYAMVRLITTYVRVTGDAAWLETRHGGRSVWQHLDAMSAHYKELDGGHGLADYGDRNSLLEAVGSYTHEVAAVNAANVWILWELADLYVHEEKPERAAKCLADAGRLVPCIQELYVQGEGYWCCRQPDGELVPCRHIWDFIHTINFMADELPGEQIDEMVTFFETELLHDSWAAALSPRDEDVSFSYRLDHQWNGSWPGWVSFAMRALFKVGRRDLLKKWIPGVASSASQGPYSQAHFVETYGQPVEGGARKGPTEWPYINDWATVCVGGFFELVVLDLFGVRPGYAALDAESSGLLNRNDVLRNVPWHGVTYDVNADGTVTLTGEHG